MSYFSDKIAEEMYRKKKENIKKKVFKLFSVDRDGYLIVKPSVPKEESVFKKRNKDRIGFVINKINIEREKRKGSKQVQTRVVGTSFIDGNVELLHKLKFGLQNKKDLLVRFVEEKDNLYDENAIAVEFSLKGAKRYRKVGYIPKNENKLIKYALNNNYSVVIDDVVFVGGIYKYENVGILLKYHFTKR